MFTPFAFDPYICFPPVHSGNLSNRGNRRLRGFMPIWDEFDRMTDEFLNDPFLNESMNIDNTNRQQSEQQESKTNQKLVKGSSANSKQRQSINPEQKQLSATPNASDNISSSGLSLWSPSWNALTVNEQISLKLDEKEDKYIVNAKLNGFNKEHLKLQVKDGLLTVSGEMKQEKNDESGYSKSTRFVCRSIALPENVNEDKISAKYENGILAVHIPKLETPKQDKKETITIE